VSDVQSILAEYQVARGPASAPEYELDYNALAQALLDARTEAVALRATEENLRTRIEDLETRIMYCSGSCKSDLEANDLAWDAVLADPKNQEKLRRMADEAALEAAAREGPSDAVLDAIIGNLREYELQCDRYDLGMELDAMRAIIRAALASPEGT